MACWSCAKTSKTIEVYYAGSLKTPRIEINIKGEIPDRLMSVLEEEYGGQIQLLEDNDEEAVNVFETAWYRDVKSKMTPGDNLRIYRENRGLTQAKLGEMLGESAYLKYERSISLKTARKLAVLFKVSPEKFI